MDSRDIDGGARWDASQAVKVPPQGYKGQPLEMGSLGAVKSAVRALFAENPGYLAWSSLYDVTKCFKSRGTDG